MRRIYCSLIGILLIAYTCSFAETNNLEFTFEEREWIKENPVVYYAPDPNFAPYEFIENGQVKGLVSDYLVNIERETGLKFEAVQLSDWPEVMSRAKEGTIDVIFATRTEERTKFLIFTEPVIEYPSMIISNKSIIQKVTEENMLDYSIGYMKDYAVQEYMTLVYPEKEVTRYLSIERALLDVSTGEVDLFIGDVGQVSYYASKINVTNLIIQDETAFRYNLRFAISDNQEILRSIMDKALAKMSEDEKENIRDKWITLGDQRPLNAEQLRTVYFGIALLILSVLGIILWNLLLKRQVHEKTRALIELNSTLESKVAERTESLKTANQALEESMENLLITQEKLVEAQKYSVLGELIVGVSHELNTPIGSTLTSATFVKRKTEDLSAHILDQQISVKEVANYAEITLQSVELIIKNLQRMSDIVNRFKIFERAQWSDQKELMDLNHVIEEILKSLNEFDSRLFSYDISFIGEEVRIETTVFWWYEIFKALMINTVVHGYDGEESGKIIIKLIDDDDEVQIIYKDCGRGISEEEQKKVFDPFYTTTEGKHYLGLGLPIVYSLVNGEMKGKLSIESEVGQYTKFIIRIPKK